MTNFMIREHRDLSFIQRWGIARTIKPQNVAEHSYYVTCYALQIADYFGLPEDRKLQIVRYALEHDIEESYVSDIPGPVKRNIKDKDKYDAYIKAENMKRFGEPKFVEEYRKSTIKQIIKIADLIDECAYLEGEHQLGNDSLSGFIYSAKERLRSALKNFPIGNKEEVRLFQEMCFFLFGRQRSNHSLPPSNNSDVE